MDQDLSLNENNIAQEISVSSEELKPFNLNLKKVLLILDEYSNCFPTKVEYEALEDTDPVKEIYFTAICLQWQYMIENAEMYSPADALIGQKVGRHSYDGISPEALKTFKRYEPTATNMLERNGLTCNGIAMSCRPRCDCL